MHGSWYSSRVPQSAISDISGHSFIFLLFSDLATGASWLFYFGALQTGNINNKVVPIDKSSTVLTMLFAFLFLGEKLTIIRALSMILIGAGTYLMLEKGDTQKEKQKGEPMAGLCAALRRIRQSDRHPWKNRITGVK